LSKLNTYRRSTPYEYSEAMD